MNCSLLGVMGAFAGGKIKAAQSVLPVGARRQASVAIARAGGADSRWYNL